MSNALRGLFITGTNTGVGKTVITAALARLLAGQGHRVGVYKPVCSGSDRDAAGNEFWRDIRELSEAVNHRFDTSQICPQRFSAPLAPPSAAKLEGRSVDAALLRDGITAWSGEVDLLLVEGIGGWLSPIAENETVADLACDLGFPILMVTALELGAINHTLLTAEAICNRGLTLAGIVANQTRSGIDDDLIRETLSEIQRFSRVPVLAHVPYGERDRMSRGKVLEPIDWISLMGFRRAAVWKPDDDQFAG